MKTKDEFTKWKKVALIKPTFSYTTKRLNKKK